MALPPPPLNRSPRGLLDFFGIQNGGRNPDTLASTLVPTMDLNLWYLLNDQECEYFRDTSFTGAFGVKVMAPGGVTAVPQNETWFVLDFSAAVGLPAIGNAVKMQLGYQISLGGVNYVFRKTNASYQTAVVAGAEQSVSARNFWLPPGSQPIIYVEDQVGAGLAGLTGTIRFSRIKI